MVLLSFVAACDCYPSRQGDAGDDLSEGGSRIDGGNDAGLDGGDADAAASALTCQGRYPGQGWPDAAVRHSGSVRPAAAIALLLSGCDCGYLVEGDDAAVAIDGALDAAVEPDRCHVVEVPRAEGPPPAECSDAIDRALEHLAPLRFPVESVVVELAPDSFSPVAMAFAGAGYVGEMDEVILTTANEMVDVGDDPQLFGPSTSGSLAAVRRRENPAGTLALPPIFAARTGTLEGTILEPTEWRDPAPVAGGCPGRSSLSGCGFDALDGTELPEETTRLGLSSVASTLLVDLIWRGAYVFDAMVVRWAPTTADDDPGRWFVVVAGGYLE